MNNVNEKNAGNSIDTIEILLGAMAFNSNLPKTYEKNDGIDISNDVKTRLAVLPIGDIDYISTINKLASSYPKWNELLLSIGMDLSDGAYESKKFHAEVVRYLASNDIMYRLDMNKKNWIIDFPEHIVKKLLASEYQFFLENAKEFVNNFYFENDLMRLRKNENQKVLQLVAA